MNTKLLVPVVIITLLFAAGSAVGMTSTSMSTTTLGNYTFQYNKTTSVVKDLQYSHEGISVALTPLIKVSSNSTTSFHFSSPQGSIVLKNATILKTHAEKLFVMISDSLNSNISVTVNNKLLPVGARMNLDQGDAFEGMNGTMGSGFTNTINIYKTTNLNGSVYYIFSNTKAKVNNTTAYFSASTQPVVLGMVPLVAQMSHIEWDHSHNSRFTYNKTTGVLTGQFLSLKLNSTSGTVSNFYDVQASRTIFSSIAVSANGTIGEDDSHFLIPVGQPILLGSIFIFSNSSYIYAFHNNPAMQSIILWKNGTVNLTMAPGLSANIILTKGSSMHYNSTMTSNFSQFSNVALESDHEIEAGRYAVHISGNGLNSYILIRDGNVSINGSNILISSNEVGKLSMVTPPGLQHLGLNVSERLNRAMESGKVAAELAITGSGTNANVTIKMNNSVNMVISKVTSGKVSLEVSSAHHRGTNIVIFVSNTVINSKSNVKVTFDGATAQISTLSGVLNLTVSSQAKFAEISTSGGVLIVIHVPHFSVHTITISQASTTSTQPTSSSLPALSGSTGKLIVAGVLILAIIGISAALIRKRKR